MKSGNEINVIDVKPSEFEAEHVADVAEFPT
jgi:hypothetical protein